MKIINIYLTPKDKKELCSIKNKYHLSFSTICNIIVYPMWEIAKKNQVNELGIVENTKGCYKTTIKPRNLNFTARQYTIATKLFIRKLYREYLTEEEFNKLQNNIYNQFKETYDENWNGNYYTRFTAKFIKKNPEYVKKLLGDN